MSCFIMLHSVYNSTLHLWYSLRVFNEFICVRDFLMAVLYYTVY